MAKSDSQDIEMRLEMLDEKKDDLENKCLVTSANRIAQEIRRLAKAEQQLISYMYACFTLMNSSSDLLDPKQGRDAALELVSLLESEDRAHALQPDVPENEYEHCVGWMSTCAYDNLAKATANLNGYNSEGVHACIADGIQVCHRTGKLECVTCFREYATDVYRAADDLDMAMHFARTGINHEDPGPHDRRWAGAKDLCEMLLQRGEITEALAAAQQAWQLAATWHTPKRAYLITALHLQEICFLLGDMTPYQELGPVGDQTLDEAFDSVPKGEFPWLDMRLDQALAVRACVEESFDRALELLSPWDRELSRRQCLHDWFDNRLRLLAVYRMAENWKHFERLAEQLEQKARDARDWLSLRCLERLRDRTVIPAPLPLVADLNAGLFMPHQPDVLETDSEDEAFVEPSESSSEEGQTQGPLDSSDGGTPAGSTAAETEGFMERVDEETSSETRRGPQAPAPIVADIWRRLVDSQSGDRSPDEIQAVFAEVLEELLQISPDESLSVPEREWLLHTMRFVLGDRSRGREVWDWCLQIARNHMNEPKVLSLLATTGASLSFGPNEELHGIVSSAQLETWFRTSLDLDPDSANNFERAGSFYLFWQNAGEAERCYARAFRLNRSSSYIALKLAHIYASTDRIRDALMVVDTCLREGNDESPVAWQAALYAHQLGKFEQALTYLDLYEEQIPDEPWTQYYRATALLELERLPEALAAAEAELRNNPDCPLSSTGLIAAAEGGLGHIDRFRGHLETVLRTPLREVDYMTPQGLANLFRRIWLASECLEDSDPLREKLETHLLMTGMAPDEMFDHYRQQKSSREEVGFYECHLLQPLDESWAESAGCLAGQEDWLGYYIAWGVLADSEQAAADAALHWQQRAGRILPVVSEVELVEDGFTDAPGVVWQAFRSGVTDEDEAGSEN